MVYVLNRDGIPLMPTRRHGKVRKMLKNGQAKVVKRCPFTIQLLYYTTNYTQPVNLGIDAGSKHTGVCATTEKEELYSADVELRQDITELLSARRENRRTRRSRKTGGNAPDNLITLCETCHNGYHKGTTDLPKTIHRGMSFKDTAFMGIMRWSFYGELKKKYPNVSMTYGYITKNTRIKHHLPKHHYTDARCIAGNPDAAPSGYYFYQKKIRCHNRQIHKANFLKGSKKKRNQAPYMVKGFRLFDKVKYGKEICFIFGRRSSGYFDLRKLDGEIIHRSASYKKIQLLETRKSFLTERRMQEIEIAGT